MCFVIFKDVHTFKVNSSITLTKVYKHMTITVVKIENVVITPKCVLVLLCQPLRHHHTLITKDDFCSRSFGFQNVT